MNAAEAIRDLTAYCEAHRCETCPMNEVLPPTRAADLCVVSLAIEKLEAVQKVEVTA